MDPPPRGLGKFGCSRGEQLEEQDVGIPMIPLPPLEVWGWVGETEREREREKGIDR